jgi:uncharacterized protein YbjT (DUF2867 family)
VRCLARDPARLHGRVPAGADVVQGDVLDAGSLRRAMEGVDVAFYMVHSMGRKGGFEDADRTGARNFARAAKAAGVRRVVYLGGLGRADEQLSPHLASRQEVGRLLREFGPPMVELQASVIIGSGSLSFELVRSLVERLPVMVTPRWVRAMAQPIAIEDVVAYCLAAAALDDGAHHVVQIGGPDRVSYLGLMRGYAQARGLRRWFIPVPVLTPWLSSLWLGLITPIFARVGRKLIDSLRHDTVVEDDSAAQLFSLRPRGVREAIARALANEDAQFASTRWSDALAAGGVAGVPQTAHLGRRRVDSRERRVAVPLDEAFAPIERIGGRTGWYAAGFLWTLRGWLDLLCGGVGMRRGRPGPVRLEVGDTVDCWRVEAIERSGPRRLLRLQAEMRLPGRAWLQFEVEPDGAGSRIRQTALYDPRGIMGRLYWWAVCPLHHWVFSGMLRGIARAAEASPPPVVTPLAPEAPA